MALLSWSSGLLLRNGLKSGKNIVWSKCSQSSAKCVDVLLSIRLPPPPKKLESSVTSSIKPDSHLGQIYSGSLGLTSPLQKWQKNRCAATAAPAPAPAAEASAIFLFRRGCPRGQRPVARQAAASRLRSPPRPPPLPQRRPPLQSPRGSREPAGPSEPAARTATPRPASRHQTSAGRRVRPPRPSRRLFRQRLAGPPAFQRE